jgi:hypothetical protein
MAGEKIPLIFLRPLYKIFSIVLLSITPKLSTLIPGSESKYISIYSQLPINTDGSLQSLSFVWETYDPIYHSTLKLKASSDSSAALSIRNQMGIYGNYVFGVGIRDVGTKNKINFGVQLDLNI